MKRRTVIIVLLAAISVTCNARINNMFRPGEVWLDDEGNVINAHGGGLLYHNGIYY